jgi:hypothetical protein
MSFFCVYLKFNIQVFFFPLFAYLPLLPPLLIGERLLEGERLSLLRLLEGERLSLLRREGELSCLLRLAGLGDRLDDLCRLGERERGLSKSL